MFAVLPFEFLYGQRGPHVETGIDDVLAARTVAVECVQRAHRFGTRYWRHETLGLMLTGLTPALGLALFDWQALSLVVTLAIDLIALWTWDMLKIALAPRAYRRELNWMGATENSARMARNLRQWRVRMGVLTHREVTFNPAMLRALAIGLGLFGTTMLLIPGSGVFAIALLSPSVKQSNGFQPGWLMLLPIALRSLTALLDLRRASRESDGSGNLQLLPQSLGPMFSVFFTIVGSVFLYEMLSGPHTESIKVTDTMLAVAFLAVSIALSAWVAWRMRTIERALAWLAAQTPEKLQHKLASIHAAVRHSARAT